MDLLRGEVNYNSSLTYLLGGEFLGVSDDFLRIYVSEFDGFRLLMTGAFHGV